MWKTAEIVDVTTFTAAKKSNMSFRARFVVKMTFRAVGDAVETLRDVQARVFSTLKVYYERFESLDNFLGSDTTS